MNIKIGDFVTHTTNGIKGKVIKQYFPTACEQQTMIKCNDGRLYHAPTREFSKEVIIMPKNNERTFYKELFNQFNNMIINKQKDGE